MIRPRPFDSTRTYKYENTVSRIATTYKPIGRGASFVRRRHAKICQQRLHLLSRSSASGRVPTCVASTRYKGDGPAAGGSDQAGPSTVTWQSSVLRTVRNSPVLSRWPILLPSRPARGAAAAVKPDQSAMETRRQVTRYRLELSNGCIWRFATAYSSSQRQHPFATTLTRLFLPARWRLADRAVCLCVPSRDVLAHWFRCQVAAAPARALIKRLRLRAMNSGLGDDQAV